MSDYLTEAGWDRLVNEKKELDNQLKSQAHESRMVLEAAERRYEERIATLHADRDSQAERVAELTRALEEIEELTDNAPNAQEKYIHKKCVAALAVIDAGKWHTPGHSPPCPACETTRQVATTEVPRLDSGAQSGTGRPASIQPTAQDTCQCGHAKLAHIYEEGACRPGFVCPVECAKYVASNEGEVK